MERYYIKNVAVKCVIIRWYAGRQIISSVHFLQDNSEKRMMDLYKDSKYLSNENMKKDLEELLLRGKISNSDYIEFIEGERLNE